MIDDDGYLMLDDDLTISGGTGTQRSGKLEVYDGGYVLVDDLAVFSENPGDIALAAPLMFYVEAGGLMSFGPNYAVRMREVFDAVFMECLEERRFRLPGTTICLAARSILRPRASPPSHGSPAGFPRADPQLPFEDDFTPEEGRGT